MQAATCPILCDCGTWPARQAARKHIPVCELASCRQTQAVTLTVHSTNQHNPLTQSGPLATIHTLWNTATVLHTRTQRTCRISAAAAAAEQADNTSSNGPQDKQTQAIQANIENAAKLIDDIVEEVASELFVSEATAAIQDSLSDASELDVIRTAVLTRIELLDANFLAALNMYIEASAKQGNTDLASLLLMIRDEVLKQVSSRLPPSAQVIDLALRGVNKDVRIAVVKTALSGGLGEIPGTDMDSLSATTSQFIEDMEEQALIADRKLLARLCLLKEELRWIDLEQNYNTPSTSFSFARSNVPQRCIAFLKELIVVNDAVKRAALLEKTFQEDWEGAAPKQKSMASQQADQPDFVRPGRLLNTLHSVTKELKVDAEKNAAVLQRLHDIHTEAIGVLDKIQRSSS